MNALSDLAQVPPPPRQLRRRRGYGQMAMNHFSLFLLLMVAWLFGRIGVGTLRALVVYRPERPPASMLAHHTDYVWVGPFETATAS